MAASSGAVYLIDPMAWTQYTQMMRTTGIEKEFIPCLSIVLRLWINPQAMWLQYLPPVLGCVWALAYYWPRRHAWDWMKQGGLLMVVSIFLAPYCWLFDQALAVPALVQGALVTRSRSLLVFLALASVVVEVELIGGVSILSVFYLWTAPAWLAWYLIASGAAGESRDAQQSS
jgi:hypothetical protein